jgi:hypothetical protein
MPHMMREEERGVGWGIAWWGERVIYIFRATKRTSNQSKKSIAF